MKQDGGQKKMTEIADFEIYFEQINRFFTILATKIK